MVAVASALRRRAALCKNAPTPSPGGPWENGYIEAFNGRLRDEHLNGERFDTLFEAQVLIEMWRNEYTQIRLHLSLAYRSPVPDVAVGEPVLKD